MGDRPDPARLLGLIGLGYRARSVVVGTDAVRRELQAGKCRCVVLADDASPRAMDKVVRLATAKAVPLLTGPGAAAIGAQMGKPPVMAVGVRDRALAGGMVQLAAAHS
jgi:ribosomal protein L7Ae-like RNA K-turn-binding protein